MRHVAYILILVLCYSCNISKSGERHVTFVIEVPDNTPEDKSIFISGDFEGWSGGNDQFKLNPIDGKQVITVRNHKSIIHYKFTLGTWNLVERDANGLDIDNRHYQFKKANDTLRLKVGSWTRSGSDKKPSTATKNVILFKDSLFIPQLKRYRTIRGYLPLDYAMSNKRYPVIYMHDGQNIFDDKTSYAVEWKVDEILNDLYLETGFQAIVIGIDNGGDHRMNEYSPYENKEVVTKPEGDAYLDFIVKTLKPEVDKTLRTKTDKANTAIMGSSMGGLISHYAGMEYPQVFGKIGVFSSSFWISEQAFELAKSKSSTLNSKMYFVVGGEEGGGMDKDTKRMVKLMTDNGFNSSNITSNIVESGTHSEAFWSAEFKDAIKWLFAEGIKKSNPPKIKAQKVKDAKVSQGKLMRVNDFPSKYIQSRPVDVWLPKNYSEEKKYAVLYMHDGQNLFDANTTWNNQEWKVDEHATELMNSNKVNDFIVVGIHNIPEIRWHDLFPEKAFNFIKQSTRDSLTQEAEKVNNYRPFSGDGYLSFIVSELKPYIDANYAVFKDKENTFVAGSSMGGLMSMYAVSEYPEVFGGAACLSTHWVGAMPMPNNPFPEAIFKYMQAHVPKAKSHKLYFDYGNKTLDAHYPQYAPKVTAILKEKGYTKTDFKNLFFENTDHSENSWNKRFNIPLEFLLGNQ